MEIGDGMTLPRLGYKGRWLLSYLHPFSGLLNWLTLMNSSATTHCEFPSGETHLARGEQPLANSHWETKPLSAAAHQELDLASEHKEGDLFPVGFQSGSSPDDPLTTACDRPRAREPSKLCQHPDPQKLRDQKCCFQVSTFWGHLLGSNR